MHFIHMNAFRMSLFHVIALTESIIITHQHQFRRISYISLSEMVQEGELYCFQIKFHGINNRTYCLSAESQEMYVYFINI